MKKKLTANSLPQTSDELWDDLHEKLHHAEDDYGFDLGHKWEHGGGLSSEIWFDERYTPKEQREIAEKISSVSGRPMPYSSEHRQNWNKRKYNLQ